MADGMFTEPRREGGLPVTTIAIAGTAVALVLALVLLLNHRNAAGPHGEQALDVYAPNIAFSHVAMSQADLPTGGTDTYIDGTVTNNGTATLDAMTVQVLFRNDTGMPPQIETEPLQLVRTLEPALDLEPLSRAPLAPAASAPFRLIVENVGSNWNGALPDIHVIAVKKLH